MSPVISERDAWEILRRYTKDCLEIDSDTLIALYATGSLPGGYYRPGQSDIDAVLIVEDGSERLWGDSEGWSKPLEELNRRYLKRYKIPKDFGPFPLQKRDLFPPYDPEYDVLTMEIARLKVQGKAVYGQFDMDTVPMPPAKDFLAGVQRFEEWCRDEFSKTNPPASMSPAACVNMILMHLSRFLRIERDIIEFNKFKVIPTYLDNEPPFANGEVFRLVEAFLASRTLTEANVQSLRIYVEELRPKMNACLGIVV